MPFITAKNLRKDYHLGKTVVNALRGIDLDIAPGEFLCVAGVSGSGKSTLLNMLGLLDRPTSGEIYMEGTRIDNLSPRAFHNYRKKNIAFIFQSFNLVPVLNAYENVEFPLLVQKVPRAEREKRIRTVLEEVGIAEWAKHRPDELSGGQRQRVAIARALVVKPALIIADEPTANLDSATGKMILELLKRLNREEKSTLLIASHDAALMGEAGRLLKITDGLVSHE